MAEGKQDIFSKLQDRGENVVGKYMPAAQRIFEAGSSLTKRVDDLTKRVKELAMLEKRVAALEKKVDKLSGPKRATTKRTTRAKAKPKPRASTKKTSS